MLLLTGHGVILVYGARVVQETSSVWIMAVGILTVDVMLFTRTCRSQTTRDWWYGNTSNTVTLVGTDHTGISYRPTVMLHRQLHVPSCTA